jgi:hypothetical protein
MTPAERLARAEERLEKAQRKARLALAEAVEARRTAAAAGVRKAAPPATGQPGPAAFDEHLAHRAIAGDETALALLRKSGGDGAYIAQLQRTLASTTNPGMKAWCAGALAQLDADFDPYGPLPRGGAR